MIESNLDVFILSLSLKDKKYAMELFNNTQAEYFSKRYRWLFNEIKHYFADPFIKEIPSWNMIKEHLVAQQITPEKIAKCSEIYNEVLTTTSDEKEFTWNLSKIKTRYNEELHSGLIKSLTEVFSTGIDPVQKLEKLNGLVKKTTVSVDAIFKRQTYKEGSLSQSVEERRNYYNQVEANPDLSKGLQTGFKTFDRNSGGLKSGELLVIVGNSGTGKSILMHNIGVNAYLGSNNPTKTNHTFEEDGKNVLYFSLEMPKPAIERRVDSCMAKVYYNELRDAKLCEQDKERYFNVLDFQLRYPKKFHIIDMPRGVTARDIELKYVELCETQFKPDLVIVDYMGIMSSNDPADSDWLSLGNISAQLHEFARVYDTIVVTGAQANRPKEGSKAEYSTNRVARSDMLVSNANIILQIAFRDNESTRTDMPIYTIKMRDGAQDPFFLCKDFGRMRVEDMVNTDFSEVEDESGI